MNSRRQYSMARRDEATAANRERVQQAVVRLAAGTRLADISLRDIAEASGVSVRTLLRYYPGRDELLRTVADELHAAPLNPRSPRPDDIRSSIGELVDEYETLGRLMLTLLGQEDTEPLARLVTDRGKAYHRRWVCELFGLDQDADAEQVDLLVVSTDLYSWKLLRLDRGLDPVEVLDRMERLALAVRAHFAGPPRAPAKRKATAGPARRSPRPTGSVT